MVFFLGLYALFPFFFIKRHEVGYTEITYPLLKEVKMVKVTTFLAVLCFLLVLGLGQVLALTWDFDKEADVEWEGLQAQRVNGR